MSVKRKEYIFTEPKNDNNPTLLGGQRHSCSGKIQNSRDQTKRVTGWARASSSWCTARKQDVRRKLGSSFRKTLNNLSEREAKRSNAKFLMRASAQDTWRGLHAPAPRRGTISSFQALPFFTVLKTLLSFIFTTFFILIFHTALM